MKSVNTLGAYVIGVLLAWVLMFAVGYFHNACRSRTRSRP
jgi:hypothetical protein